jgi:mannose-6-phosphate isomerase
LPKSIIFSICFIYDEALWLTRHKDCAPQPFEIEMNSKRDLMRRQLNNECQRLLVWLFEAALPLWWENGADHSEGGFHELLDQNGKPPPSFRRARVQARQSYVYSTAGLLGWTGPFEKAAHHGLEYLRRRYLQPNGQFCTLVSSSGEIQDADCYLYDQAFVLLALASLKRIAPEERDLSDAGHKLFERIELTRKHKAKGYVECGRWPYVSNPHMHLLEALLAWCETEPGEGWEEKADTIATLCLDNFIDTRGGFLREYFDEAWRPAPGAEGHIVEPGHQFEWAWLLHRWSRLCNRNDAFIRLTTSRLFEAGTKGIDSTRDVAIFSMTDTFKATELAARLWAQTERVKAALALLDVDEEGMLAQALRGIDSLKRYLDTPLPGLWRDRLEPNGHFVEEAAPASSFYHLACCVATIHQTANADLPL